MNIILKVQPEALSSKSNEITVEKNNILSTLEQVKSEMNGLVGAWKSPASDEFQLRFKQLYDDMENVIAIINEYVSDLNEAAGIYTTAESSVKAATEGLPVDGVFRN
jgi:WXG100 family type VII secretion target